MRTLAALVVFTSALAAKSYQVDGIVIAVDRVAHSMLVSHRSIPKYMGAMMMSFRVEDPEDLKPLYPGARVQFELVVSKNGSLARRIRKAPGGDAQIPPPTNKLAIGDPLPDFTLTDQNGGSVRLSDLRGKVLAIDFIYTRCPLPDVCPLLSANFAALSRHFSKELGSDLVLLSVTVDPEYDTPPVLAAYAKRWRADARGWRFLTGDVALLAGALGEVYWSDEGSIGHNSTTSIIGRDGHLAAVVEGSGWRLEQMQYLIANAIDSAR
jgi:protein SCO1/2